MARFTNGWVKLHREILDKDINSNPNLLAIWVNLLLMATYKESQIIYKGRQRILPPGSVVMGLHELADKWELSKKTIRKWLIYLQKTNRIGYEGVTRGSIITICNWELYQTENNDEVTLGLRRGNAEVTPGLRRGNISEEVKNIRKKELYTPDPADQSVCESDWICTLKHFAIDRPILPFEKARIAKALKHYGLVAVRHALIGMRYESPTDTFKPAEHVDIHRCFKRERFSKNINLAIMEDAKLKQMEEVFNGKR